MRASTFDLPVPLLVAEYLNAQHRLRDGARLPANIAVHEDTVRAFLVEAREDFGKLGKSAREPGGERELTDIALDRLAKQQLIARDGDRFLPLPALARFACGAPIAPVRRLDRNTRSRGLFDPT